MCFSLVKCRRRREASLCSVSLAKELRPERGRRCSIPWYSLSFGMKIFVKFWYCSCATPSPKCFTSNSTSYCSPSTLNYLNPLATSVKDKHPLLYTSKTANRSGKLKSYRSVSSYLSFSNSLSRSICCFRSDTRSEEATLLLGLAEEAAPLLGLDEEKSSARREDVPAN